MHRVTIRYTLADEAGVAEKVQMAPSGELAVIRATRAFRAMMPGAVITDVLVD